MSRKPAPALDLKLVPGSPAEQRSYADRLLLIGGMPIAIVTENDGYHVYVIGTDIGRVTTKEAARSAAHQIGRYRLELGDFVSTYCAGY